MFSSNITYLLLRAAEIVQEQQRHVGDDDANAALRFFFTTLYETQTETDSTTVTR